MTDSATHADLMDSTYRYQRLFYDITRRYYLLGRDHLIVRLEPHRGARILEVACGTGRNLARTSRRYPEAELYGMDISQQMLLSARKTLGEAAQLKQGDACTFDGRALFDCDGFDRVVISYGMSMIPDWQGAIRNAAAQLRPGGELHIVDFGDQRGLPLWFRKILFAWLDRFHVTPREMLEEVLRQIAGEMALECNHTPLFRGYAQYGCLVKG